MRLGIDFLAHRLGSGRQCFMMALPVLPVMRRTTAGPLASGGSNACAAQCGRLRRAEKPVTFSESQAAPGSVLRAFASQESREA